MYTFWHPLTPPKYLKNEVATKLTSELFVCLKLTQVSEGVYCTCGMIWRCFRTFEWSIGTVGPVLHVYLICFWRDWGHLDTPKFIKMASNSRVTRTGVVGRAVWRFFTRVRSINWCPLLRVTIRTFIAAWSQGLRLTGRDIELCTRFDTPNSPELTPTSNSRVTRTGVVDHVVWLFCKSTVDRLVSTLESDY